MTVKSGKLGKSFVVTLSIGIVFGFGFAYLILTVNTKGFQQGTFSYYTTLQREDEQRLDDHGHAQESGGDAHTHDKLREARGPYGHVSEHSHDEEMHRNEGVEAEILAKEVRVLCWVLTSPDHHEKRAKHVKLTWGKRCNKLIFMSSAADEELGSIALPNVKEGRNYLWAKTKEAFKYVFEHHFEEADWFLKADDDTYVIVENLRFMLKAYDPKSPLYFGCHFKPLVKNGYMSGGAGYVLSKESLKRFVKDALPDKNKCNTGHGGSEDVEIGRCLQNVGVIAGDSRDELGRYRFNPFVPEHHLIPGHVSKTFWYWRYIYYPQKEGLDCCSDTAISFHYVSPNQMYVLEYLIYHLRPYGINRQISPLTSHPQLNVPTTTLVTERVSKRTTLASFPPRVPLVDDPTKASDWLLPSNDSGS